MTLILPEAVKKIISILESNGHEAYAVGGCVRDSILGKNPYDWDITTSALPEEIKSVFNRTIDTGIKHGTVTVRIFGEGYEVTTYRVDGDYLDGRHPKEVSFTASLEEDLARRDFTINAMAYNDRSGLVDIFGGREDLENGILRCVGDPELRFTEDALRMMRALRFAAQLDFKIEPDTYAAIKKLHKRLEMVSAERIREEFLKLIVSDHPELLDQMSEVGLTSVFLPEWDMMIGCEQNTPHHAYDVSGHTIRAMQGVDKDKDLRLAALLHDVAKPLTKTTDESGDHFSGHPVLGEKMSKKILSRLKFDNATIARVSAMVLWHDVRPEPDKKSVRRVVSKMPANIFPDIFSLKKADILAQSEYKREEKLQRLEAFQDLYNSIKQEGECISIGDLAVGGKDMMDIGISKGPMIGAMLKKLLDMVIDDPTLNEKEVLMDIARKEYEGEGNQ
ncbi:MAG: HDIG domain-containing protein [Lachnospiraceae bacterium]|nr:HDIG domain-containing protein [Lachnospiraceae bacterium]